MEEKREPESFMMRVARFIVNKRKAYHLWISEDHGDEYYL